MYISTSGTAFYLSNILSLSIKKKAFIYNEQMGSILITLDESNNGSNKE